MPSALGVHDTGREGGARVAPNWYVPPGFDAVQMINDLGQQLNGSGGNIEQTHVYLDHKSARSTGLHSPVTLGTPSRLRGKPHR